MRSGESCICVPRSASLTPAALCVCVWAFVYTTCSRLCCPVICFACVLQWPFRYCVTLRFKKAKAIWSLTRHRLRRVQQDTQAEAVLPSCSLDFFLTWCKPPFFSFFQAFRAEKRNVLPHSAENICWWEMKAWERKKRRRRGIYINTSGAEERWQRKNNNNNACTEERERLTSAGGDHPFPHTFKGESQRPSWRGRWLGTCAHKHTCVTRGNRSLHQ